MIKLVSEALKIGIVEHVEFNLPFLNAIQVYQYSAPSDRYRYPGLGSSDNSELAKIKSFYEFIERNFLDFLNSELNIKTSNGVAAHESPEKARASAVSEILERDSFLLHWYSETPFEKIDSIPRSAQSIARDLVSLGYTVIFARSYLGLLPTYCCFIRPPKDVGFALGLSAGKEEYQDIEKAFHEAIINLFLGGGGLNKEALLEELKIKGLTTLRCHRTLWLHVLPIPGWIVDGANNKRPFNGANGNVPPVEILAEFNEKNVSVCACRMPDCLDLEVGFPSEETVHKLNRRLENKFKHKTRWDFKPHPIP